MPMSISYNSAQNRGATKPRHRLILSLSNCIDYVVYLADHRDLLCDKPGGAGPDLGPLRPLHVAPGLRGAPPLRPHEILHR